METEKRHRQFLSKPPYLQAPQERGLVLFGYDAWEPQVKGASVRRPLVALLRGEACSYLRVSVFSRLCFRL